MPARRLAQVMAAGGQRSYLGFGWSPEGFGLPQPGDRYDGGDRRKYGEWGMTQTGPNASMFTYERDRNRVREMMVYSGTARAAIEQFVANAIGDSGFTPRLGQYPAWQKILRKWAKECDPRGEFTFLALQKQAASLVFRDGACLVRFRERFDDVRTPRSRLRIQIQVMEIDHLPASLNRVEANGNRTIGGVERDATDRPVAYWLYPWHPQDFAAAPANNDPRTPVRVPADQVLLIKDIGRPGEARPSPPLRTALPSMRDRDGYVGLEVERKKVAAQRAYWVHTPGLPDDPDVLRGIFGSDATVDAAEGEDTAGATYIISRPAAGDVGVLPPGYTIEDSRPADVGESFEPFMRAMDRSIATACGVPYPFISGDWTGINDRIYRGITLEFRRAVGFFQQAIMIDQFCQPIYERLCAWALVNNLFEIAPEDIDEVMDVDWSTPRAGYINPLQEVNAYKAAEDAGYTSRQRVIGELGEDPASIAVERAIEKALEEQLASDPRVQKAIQSIVEKTIGAYVANIGSVRGSKN